MVCPPTYIPTVVTRTEKEAVESRRPRDSVDKNRELWTHKTSASYRPNLRERPLGCTPTTFVGVRRHRTRPSVTAGGWGGGEDDKLYLVCPSSTLVPSSPNSRDPHPFVGGTKKQGVGSRGRGGTPERSSYFWTVLDSGPSTR